MNSTGIATTMSIPFNLASARFTPWQTAIFLSIVLPVIVFTLVSNTFVVYTVSTHPTLKNPSNLFMLSLAVTDLLAAIFVMPIACYYNIVGVWHLKLIGCQVCGLDAYCMYIVIRTKVGGNNHFS